MVNKEFISLCSKAWAIQVLAYLFAGGEPRIAPITHHFSVGRTSISAALQHLIVLGYLRKNTGHGHPLRPAYVLTAKGKVVAEWAAQLDGFLAPNDWKIARRTWTLPILRQTIPTRRFGELRADLRPVTDRALSESLKTLGEKDWLQREVDSESSPPSVTYKPSGLGRILVPSLEDSLHL